MPCHQAALWGHGRGLSHPDCTTQIFAQGVCEQLAQGGMEGRGCGALFIGSTNEGNAYTLPLLPPLLLHFLSWEFQRHKECKVRVRREARQLP